LRLLLRAGSSFTDQAVQLACKLLSTEAEAESPAFLQVLSWSWNQLGDTSRETPVHGTMRLALAWAHAEALCGILRSVSEPAQIHTFFTNNNQPPPSESIACAAGEEDVTHPRHVTPYVFLVCGFASALRNEARDLAVKVPELQARVAGLCFQQRESLRWPKLEWLNDPALWGNGLGSFLGEPRAVLLEPILGPEKSAELSAQRVFREIEAAVSALESSPATDNAWLILGALLRGNSCPAALRLRIRSLIERYDATSGSFSERERFPILSAIAAQAWPIGGAPLAEHVRNQIVAFARWLSGRSESGSFNRKLAVLNCVEALARSVPSDQAVTVFVGAVNACLNTWPDLVNSLPGGPGLFLELPPQQLADSWSLLLRIRRDSDRM
jgi:hypothetical protein